MEVKIVLKVKNDRELVENMTELEKREYAQRVCNGVVNHIRLGFGDKLIVENYELTSLK